MGTFHGEKSGDTLRGEKFEGLFWENFPGGGDLFCKNVRGNVGGIVRVSTCRDYDLCHPG